jgi:hypothetical protein
LALTDGTGDKYKFFFPEEMGHLVSLFVWAFDLYLMSFEGYVMDSARGKDSSRSALLQAILELCSALACLEEFVSFWARLKGFLWISMLSCLRILEVLSVWGVLGGFVVMIVQSI